LRCADGLGWCCLRGFDYYLYGADGSRWVWRLRPACCGQLRRADGLGRNRVRGLKHLWGGHVLGRDGVCGLKHLWGGHVLGWNRMCGVLHTYNRK